MNTTPTDAATSFFLSHFKRGRDCWFWTGKKDDDGYGYFSVAGNFHRAHRFSYRHFTGEIPADKPWVLHSCDNPSCVNPRHLWVGDNAANTADRTAKGRSAKGEKNGWSTLKAGQVAEIRRMISAGISQRQIAKEFSINQSTVCKINRNQRWKI